MEVFFSHYLETELSFSLFPTYSLEILHLFHIKMRNRLLAIMGKVLFRVSLRAYFKKRSNLWILGATEESLNLTLVFAGTFPLYLRGPLYSLRRKENTCTRHLNRNGQKAESELCFFPRFRPSASYREYADIANKDDITLKWSIN